MELNQHATIMNLQKKKKKKPREIKKQLSKKWKR